MKNKLKSYQVQVTYSGIVTFDIWAESEDAAKTAAISYTKMGEQLSAQHYLTDITPEIVGEGLV